MADAERISALEAENAALRAEVERLRGERADRARLELLEAVVQKLTKQIYVYDAVEQRNVFTNRKLASMLGYSEDELLAMGEGVLPAIIHPDDLARIPAQIDLVRAAQDGEVVPIEYRLRDRTGAYRWVEDRIVVFSRDADGAMRQYLGMLEDTTERKRIEAEAQLTSRAVLQSFLDHTPALMFVKDLEGRFILINKEMERFLGKRREEILGRTNRAFIPPEIAARSDEAERRALAEGSAQVVNVHERPEGVAYYHNIKFPVVDEHGAVRGVGTVAVDVTREHREAEARAAREAEIIEAQRAMIRELASPLLPIADDVVAMPLVGTLDDARARQILEALVEGVSRHGARVAIVDITGVREVDNQVAHAIVQAGQAAKLLGAQVVLTGVSPEVARTLVGLEADLRGMVTLGTLQAGIAWAMQGRARVPGPRGAV